MPKKLYSNSFASFDLERKVGVLEWRPMLMKHEVLYERLIILLLILARARNACNFDDMPFSIRCDVKQFDLHLN